MASRPPAPLGPGRPPLISDRARLRARQPAPLEAVPDPPPAPNPGAGSGRVPALATPHEPPCAAAGAPPVALVRTPRGWAVVVAGIGSPVSGLIEGLSLADLVVEEFGGIPEPDRSARRSARGAAPVAEDADPRDSRIAALERTVAQLEHALAARVATERAIGVLAERHGIGYRQAFEVLRADARTHGRAVQDLARDVLDGRTDPGAAGSAPGRADGVPGRPTGSASPAPPMASTPWDGWAPTADGAS